MNWLVTDVCQQQISRELAIDNLTDVCQQPLRYIDFSGPACRGYTRPVYCRNRDNVNGSEMGAGLSGQLPRHSGTNL